MSGKKRSRKSRPNWTTQPEGSFERVEDWEDYVDHVSDEVQEASAPEGERVLYVMSGPGKAADPSREYEPIVRHLRRLGG